MFLADWDYRRRVTASATTTPTTDSTKSHSLTRKVEVDMGVDHRHRSDSPIDLIRSQSQITAAAQVEIYPTKKYTQDNQQRQQDSTRSVSPLAATWNSPLHQLNNARVADRARVRQDGPNTGESFIIIFYYYSNTYI